VIFVKIDVLCYETFYKLLVVINLRDNCKNRLLFFLKFYNLFASNEYTFVLREFSEISRLVPKDHGITML
jgi:hypothetical protein